MAFLDDTLVELFHDTSKDVSNKNKILLTDDVKFHKVAFDMVRVYGDHYDDLWKIEEEDGMSYLVRASGPGHSQKEAGDWSALGDFDRKNITLSYKSVPICRFSSDEYGFSSDDILTFKSALLDRVKDDGDFIKEVLMNQPSSKVEALSCTFPELKDFIK